jgi:hypothetical protein
MQLKKEPIFIQMVEMELYCIEAKIVRIFCYIRKCLASSILVNWLKKSDGGWQHGSKL